MADVTPLLTYGRVTDTAMAGIAERGVVDVAGTATFTPTLPSGTPLVFIGAPGVFFPLPIVATYDASGVLSVDGAEFADLIATDVTSQSWQWQVTFTSLTANGQAVPRNSFKFSLPAGSIFDLAQGQTIATANGVPIAQGPAGASGTGLIIRGVVVGVDSSVLPTGYGSAQNGYTWRVRSSLSVSPVYDELWVWVWTGNSGSWVDAGVFGGAVINDSIISTSSVYSSQEVEVRDGATLVQAEAYTDGAVAAAVPSVEFVIQNADLSWPLRPNATYVVWLGLTQPPFPPTGVGYAQPGDGYEGLVTLS